MAGSHAVVAPFMDRSECEEEGRERGGKLKNQSWMICWGWGYSISAFDCSRGGHKVRRKLTDLLELAPPRFPISTNHVVPASFYLLLETQFDSLVFFDVKKEE